MKIKKIRRQKKLENKMKYWKSLRCVLIPIQIIWFSHFSFPKSSWNDCCLHLIDSTVIRCSLSPLCLSFSREKQNKQEEILQQHPRLSLSFSHRKHSRNEIESSAENTKAFNERIQTREIRANGGNEELCH